jgi:hypothetical protein
MDRIIAANISAEASDQMLICRHASYLALGLGSHDTRPTIKEIRRGIFASAIVALLFAATSSIKPKGCCRTEIHYEFVRGCDFAHIHKFKIRKNELAKHMPRI